ncbi:MAG TPA: type II secretion system minor pseudopilin GspK [Rhodanobacteraceae bacterium]|nr:type II secretion system minor pseudopilin GspK [Rhodanobacteraceae bacterium]
MSGASTRQRGVALLVALLVVALAAVLIAGLLDRGELALARTRNALRGEQAEAYAQALEAYAAEVLIKDADEGGDDTNTDIWAAPLPPQPVPGGVMLATMRDLNGCFNLNNLARVEGGTGIDVWERMFRRLLDARGVDRSLMKAIEQWLAADSSDVTDAYYLARPVPYRSAQRLFVHVSELRLVQGVTGDVYARLAPYVCALPRGTPINVNTASVPVLQTLGDGISTAEAERLWQNGQAHWSGDFWKQWNGIDVDTAVESRDYAGTKSSYFLARGDVTLDGIPFTFYSLIERGKGVQVIERSRGSDDALVAPAIAEPLGANR